MALHVVSDTANPSTAPDNVGEHHVNTSTGNQFLASGTGSAADWEWMQRVFIPMDKTSNYTVTVSDNQAMLEVDATASNTTITLPALSAVDDGFCVIVQKSDSGSNTVTLDGDSSETINGATTYVLSKQYDSVYVVKDSTEWHVVARNTATEVTGPTSSTDNAWSRFDGTGGSTLQDGAWTEDDSGNATAGGNLDMSDNQVQQPELKDYGVTHNNVSSSSGSVTFDYSTGNSFDITLTENITSITLSNPPASGTYGEIVIEFVQDGTGSRTVSGWPAAVKWAGGSAPTITSAASSIDKVVLSTRDGGTTWLGNYSQDYS